MSKIINLVMIYDLLALYHELHDYILLVFEERANPNRKHCSCTVAKYLGFWDIDCHSIRGMASFQRKFSIRYRLFNFHGLLTLKAPFSLKIAFTVDSMIDNLYLIDLVWFEI